MAVHWLAFLNACYYDNEDLYPNTVECVTDSMSFKNDIFPIINNNCVGCHNSGALQGVLPWKHTNS